MALLSKLRVKLALKVLNGSNLLLIIVSPGLPYHITTQSSLEENHSHAHYASHQNPIKMRIYLTTRPLISLSILPDVDFVLCGNWNRERGSVRQSRIPIAGRRNTGLKTVM